MSKRALEVADQIEASVCDLDWEYGAMVGDETALMVRYQVGRSVFRQAIRLSEHLGVAEMRRGRTGGLVVAVPDAKPAALSLQIAWSKQRVQRRSAERLRDTVAEWASSGPKGAMTLSSVVSLACAGFASTGVVGIQSMDCDKLGEQIAQNILATLSEQRWETEDDLLGSEAQLMKIYSEGRASLREAVHLLELHGVAVMQRGPGGGLLVLRAPSSGALLRSIRAQLRSTGLTDGDICALMRDFLITLPAGDLQDAGMVLRNGSNELLNSLAATPTETSGASIRGSLAR